MMKVWDNGVVREMTAEEVAALRKEQSKFDQEPTTEERLAALESAMLAQILGGVSNV